jgi:hypothetical protein
MKIERSFYLSCFHPGRGTWATEWRWARRIESSVQVNVEINSLELQA